MTPDNARKLEAAAALVGEVVATLDERSATCECCHMTRYENWEHHTKGKELRALQAKLLRFASSGAAKNG